ncbi:MAG TPA: hypothetical protein VIV60_31110 [Polyangiaceae bacterium]
MNAKMFGLFAILITAFACRNQSADTQTAPSASPSVVLSDEALDQAAVPVKEDFEERAQKEVTEENLDDQVSQLEKQIDEDH